MKYDKKVLIIYNPNSGRRLNVRVQISKELDKQGIPYEFYETKGYLDGLNHVMTFEIENYSAIAAVGGDGTIHEIINGLLKRRDGKKVPIALLPNGSGNDACGGIKVDTMEQAISYLVKGDTIKLDVIKCLIDIEEGYEADHDHLRYSIINSGLCLVANCARNAVRYKSCMGKHAYSLATVLELIKRRQERFDIIINDGEEVIKDMDT